MSIVCLFAFLLAGSAHATPSAVRHEAPRLPNSWSMVGQPDVNSISDNHPIVVRFALKQSNLNDLREIALRVSDPRSTEYGQHLSAAEVSRITAPCPEHTKAVEHWLIRAGAPFSRPGSDEIIEVRLTAGATSELLHTRFHHAVNVATRQQAILAGDYWLPSEVHNAVAAVYGLHGVPAPPRDILSVGMEAQSVNVTPDVIRATYRVSGVTPSGSMTKNRQAVWELKNQRTIAEDLQEFFKHYVSDAPEKDATVYKFVGDNGTGVPGGEAELDIEYIMGVAPGILTEFWYVDEVDTCTGLRSFTDMILKDDNPPLVHSVSYGIQGPLDQMMDCINDVETNLVKLAARGITIIAASGDTGSGLQTSCAEDAMLVNISVMGLHLNLSSTSPSMCCELVGEYSAWYSRIYPGMNFTAWTYMPPAQPQCSPKSGTAFEGAQLRELPLSSEQSCCTFAGSIPSVAGYTFTASTSNCVLFSEINGSKVEPLSSSSYLAVGVCSAFWTVTGTAPTPGATSGGHGVKPAPKLYPAWPATSPWVTAVGATRFVDQQVGQPEMASDKFGSGGGFSTMFSAFEYQADVVNHYLKIAPGLPPNNTFPPGGRATPDVSALGEGYQVIVDGQLNVEAGTGTSASAPTFAAMVSLLNEARLKAGQKPMGYLNPFLYQNGDAFTDVVIGTNAIDRSGDPFEYGFQCARGWDPVTGLGTPIFPKLLGAALAAGRTTIHV